MTLALTLNRILRRFEICPITTSPVLIRQLVPKNFLSFGPDNSGIELQALNLFIGPNGSGKLNLIEAISLMRSAPKELRDVTQKGGGVAEWIWKGDPKSVAKVEWIVTYPKELKPLRHKVAFHPVAQAFALVDESRGRNRAPLSSREGRLFLLPIPEWSSDGQYGEEGSANVGQRHD